MDSSAVQEAARATGCLRYWSLEDTTTIVETGSQPLPGTAAPNKEFLNALSKAYWRTVRGDLPSLLPTFFKRRTPKVPQTRSKIVEAARGAGFDGVWALLQPLFRGKVAPWGLVQSKELTKVFLELGPHGVGLAVGAFAHSSFESQDAFCGFGMVFLERAKLLVPLFVSFVTGNKQLAERIVWASVSVHRIFHPTVKALLDSVVTIPACRAAAEAGLAELVRYPQEESKSPFGDTRFRPEEKPSDVICDKYTVPGGVC